MKKFCMIFLTALLTALMAASVMASETTYPITPNPSDIVNDESMTLTLSSGDSSIECGTSQFTSTDIADELSEDKNFYSELTAPEGYTGGKILSEFSVWKNEISLDLVDAIHYTGVPATIGNASDLYLYFVTENFSDSTITVIASMSLASCYDANSKKLDITKLPTLPPDYWDSSHGIRLIIVQATGKASAETIESVTLDKTALTIVKGESKTLTATIAPTTASNTSVTWKSNNTDVATVDSAGKVTGVAAGTATVTATSAADTTKSATCSVTVTAPAAADTIHIVTPAYIDAAKSADIAAAISTDVANLAVNEDGKLVLSKTVQDNALKSVISSDSSLKDGSLKVFPIISNAVTSGEIAAVQYAVSGDVFGVSAVKDIKVFKIFPDGTAKAFTIITADTERGDMMAALYDKDGKIVTETIDKNASYTLTTFVKDGGTFDLDSKTNGNIIDPVGIAQAASSSSSDSGSSGGCSAGFSVLALLSLAALPLWRKKK